jgi:hypothetical protein
MLKGAGPMAKEDSSGKRAVAAGSARSPFGGNSRLAIRLFALPVLAVAAVLIFNGLRDRFALPECDSETAKQTLADVLRQLNLVPVRYEPIKTVSSSKQEVVCNAVLPLPDGATVVVDYSFQWQGGKANMTYSVSRRAPGSSTVDPAPSLPSPASGGR